MSHIVDIPHPSERVADAGGLMSRVWWSALDRIIRAVKRHVPLTGTATFVAGTTIAVVFETAEASDEYNVHIEAVANRTYWVTDKLTTGFTINASASNSDTVGWTVMRR